MIELASFVIVFVLAGRICAAYWTSFTAVVHAVSCSERLRYQATFRQRSLTILMCVLQAVSIRFSVAVGVEKTRESCVYRAGGQLNAHSSAYHIRRRFQTNPLSSPQRYTVRPDFVFMCYSKGLAYFCSVYVRTSAVFTASKVFWLLREVVIGLMVLFISQMAQTYWPWAYMHTAGDFP